MAASTSSVTSARLDAIERSAIDRVVGQDVSVRVRRGERPHASASAHPATWRRARRSASCSTVRRSVEERSLVPEVAGLEAAVEAEEQVGTALVGAERLDEQLGTIGADTEVGRGSAGIDAGLLESLHGQSHAARVRR